MRIVAGDIPTRVQGIPLNLNELAISMDRDGLVLNPSTCGTAKADASYSSVQGGSSSGGADYTTDGCGNLNWKPDFKIGFSGPAAELSTSGHPTISTVISQAEGQGNLRAVKVTLPEGVATDPANINKRVCPSAETAVAGGCAATATIGTADIVTSALPNSVKGDVVLVKIPGKTLPGVMVHVRDQISLDLLGQSSLESSSGRLVVAFDAIPDTPISKMTLVFNGGSTGIIQVGKVFCGVSGAKTDALLTAQHGATKSFAVRSTATASRPRHPAPAARTQTGRRSPARPSGPTVSLHRTHVRAEQPERHPSGRHQDAARRHLHEEAQQARQAQPHGRQGEGEDRQRRPPHRDLHRPEHHGRQDHQGEVQAPQERDQDQHQGAQGPREHEALEEEACEGARQAPLPSVTTVDNDGKAGTVKLKTAFK